MKTKIKNPARVRERRVQSQKIKSFNMPIIGDSRAKSQASPSNYKQIVEMFRHSGGHDEAEIYLSHWGVSPTIKDLLLAYAEYDALTSGGVA
jgi:hypothetical protein